MRLRMSDVEVELVLPLQFQQQLTQAGGAAVVDLLQRACAAAADSDVTASREQVAELAIDAYERSWEQLHCGSWKSIAPVWRQAFGFASVLQACCLFQSQQFVESLKMLDMCLMMAGPFAMPETHALIAGVEAQLAETQRVWPAVASPDEDDEQRRLKKPRLVLYEEQGVDFPVRRLSMPSLEEFRRDVMQRNSPVIITDAMEFWPALGRAGGAGRSWKDLQYLRRVAGWRTVPIEVGSSYLEEDWGQELMTVNEFLDRHIIPSSTKSKVSVKGDDATDPEAARSEEPARTGKLGYLAQHHLFDQIPALARDIITPDYCTVSRIENDEDEDIAVNAWFGPDGTVSPLHFDPKDNLLCQVVGAKYLRLYAPEESDKLYPVEGLLSNTSQVQVEAPDDEQFPDFHRAKYLECVLKEGEMLYIPPGYWHYVKSLDTSFSVSFWWT